MTQASVNRGLTSKRRTEAVENNQFHAFARRVLRAYSRRVGSGDVEALAELVALTAELDQAIHEAVQGLRDFGYSWGDIATRLGLTRQAAWHRWSAETPSEACPTHERTDDAQHS